jgi:DNA primase
VHGGDNPHAFVVSLSKNLWYCFTRCSSGGDAVKFIRCLDNISYVQAVRYLSTLCSCDNVYQDLPSLQGASQSSFQPFSRRLFLEHNIPFLWKKGIKAGTGAYFEAGAYHGLGFLNNCVAVRLHDPSGVPLGYAGRRLNQNEVRRFGKWKFPPRLPKNKILYNLHRIVHSHPDNPLVIVECPWAVMRLTQLKFHAVALLGVNLSGFQLHLLKNHRQIILMLDGDKAGHIAAGRIAENLADHKQVHTISLPQNRDPDDLTDTDLTALLNPFFS